MTSNFQRANRSFFIVIVIGLSLVVALASTFAYLQQQKLLFEGLERKTALEADFLGGLLKDSMLRNDYSEGLRLISDWPHSHTDVVKLNITLDNGQTFFTYDKDSNLESSHGVTKDFTYGNRVLTLTLALDTSAVERALDNLVRTLFSLSVFVIVLIVSTLWYVLFRWIIRPMEAEITKRTHDIVLAKDSLEKQVNERTASLAAEIQVREQAEQSLRKLARAVDQSPILIFITGLDGKIEYVNPKFEEVTGYSPQEAIGKSSAILKSSDTPSHVHKDLWDTILSGTVWHAEIKDRRKDGSEFWANATISPIRDSNDNITHFVAMHEDITDRKAAELAMQDARTAAEVANKAKSELMANMSHELRTPLNAIIGFSETMTHSIFGPLGHANYTEYASFIHSSALHLLQLINNILDVAAVEAGKFTLHEEDVIIEDIVRSTMQIVMPKAQQANITVTSLNMENLPALHADPLRLKQILINLLSNAVKFTPDGGSVTCSARVDSAGDMIITVADTGIGMDSDDLAKALDKFGQVDSSLARKHEGTGLGLPLTLGLIELHDGTMRIDSTPGKGTKVQVTLPASRVLNTRREPPLRVKS